MSRTATAVLGALGAVVVLAAMGAAQHNAVPLWWYPLAAVGVGWNFYRGKPAGAVRSEDGVGGSAEPEDSIAVASPSPAAAAKQAKRAERAAAREARQVQRAAREAADHEQYGAKCGGGVFGTREVNFFARGYVKVSMAFMSGGAPYEKLIAIEASSDVQKKSGLGRGAAAAVTMGASLAAASNMRGDVYLTITTQNKTHVLHVDPPTARTMKTAKQLEAEGRALIASAR
ncbi:MAG: hypothetical protein ACJ71Z_13265 [Aeromicrobium sp.]